MTIYCVIAGSHCSITQEQEAWELFTATAMVTKPVITLCAVSSETWMQLQSLITQLYREDLLKKKNNMGRAKKRLGLADCCHEYITQVERQFRQLFIVHEKTELFAIS